MIIKKSRVRNIRFLDGLISKGDQFYIGISQIDRFKERLVKAGFSTSLSAGETVLPSPIFGPISLFNAEGKHIKHKDRPMETAYRTVEWHWKEWHGPYHQVEQSDFRDVPYQRYQRSFVPPPSMEFTICSVNDDVILTAPVIELSDDNEAAITHAINLFLEIFGECQFFAKDRNAIIKVPVIRLNWKILPQGQMPWAKLHEEVKPIITSTPEGNQPFIYHRLEKLNKYKPDFVAVGQGGFRGYVVFGFKNKAIYTFESIFYGNATYVFGEQWENLSKMTKAEILNEKLQKERIIHLKSWDKKIAGLLNS